MAVHSMQSIENPKAWSGMSSDNQVSVKQMMLLIPWFCWFALNLYSLCRNCILTNDVKPKAVGLLHQPHQYAGCFPSTSPDALRVLLWWVLPEHFKNKSRVARYAKQGRHIWCHAIMLLNKCCSVNLVWNVSSGLSADWPLSVLELWLWIKCLYYCKFDSDYQSHILVIPTLPHLDFHPIMWSHQCRLNDILQLLQRNMTRILT